MQAVERLPEPVEVAAYYVISEALTNAVKHSNASVVQIGAEIAVNSPAGAGTSLAADLPLAA